MLGQIGFSQDWQLFIKNQTSYYEQQYDSSIIVESFLLDSSINNNGVEQLLFNSKSDLSNECYLNLKNAFNSISSYNNENKIDSLKCVKDSVFYFSFNFSSPDTFIIKPYSHVNDSWTTNSFKFNCTSTSIQNVFGVEDSIKIFKCKGSFSDTIEFILSKSFGLLKFLPFFAFTNNSNSLTHVPYFDFIGFSKLNIAKGYVQPDFSNYFHLSKGDVLLWRDYSRPDDIRTPESTTYHMDSITFAYISLDSVYYEYKSNYYDKNGLFSSTVNNSDFYLRKHEGKILKNLTSWFGYSPYGAFYFQSLGVNIKNSDTVTIANYDLPGIELNTSNCLTSIIADYGMSVSYSTREGKIFQGSYSWGEFSSTLIGSIIKGINYGSTKIPTGINIQAIEGVSIYPNPVLDNLNISSQTDDLKSLELFEVGGNLILSKPYKQTINLKDIKSGIYILRLVDIRNISKYYKIIKQ